MVPPDPAEGVTVQVRMEAEQVAFVPPFNPVQPQVHGPVPLTAVAVPTLQRFVVGAAVNVCPFDAPQAPLTGITEKLATMV